jgi:hypothetical protein
MWSSVSCVYIYMYIHMYICFLIYVHTMVRPNTNAKCSYFEVFEGICISAHSGWFIYICVLYIYNVYYICICIYSYMHTHGFLQKCGPWSSTQMWPFFNIVFRSGLIQCGSIQEVSKAWHPDFWVGIHHFLPNRKSRNCSGTFSLRFSGVSADPLG